jgi:nitroreductase
VDTRRSTRRFTDEQVGKDALEKLLQAARWAPSGGNRQRWRFVVVTSLSPKELVREFAFGIFDMPAAFIVICVEREADIHAIEEATSMADCAIASPDIMLVAYEMGLGTCVAPSYAQAAIAQILKPPHGVEPLWVITVGYPAEDPKAPARFELDQIGFVDDTEEVDVMSERMVVSEEDLYEMLSSLVTSAQPTVHEPRLYGTLRLIDALPDS